MPPGFQGQGASNSNNQGQRRPPFFEENVLYLLNDMKKNNDSRIVNLETTQTNMGASLKIIETQMGQLAHSMKESSTRHFPSDTEKNSKDCMTITLWSGKNLGIPKMLKMGRLKMRRWWMMKLTVKMLKIRK